MTNTKKQLKINKMFRKGATQLPEECEEMQQEIQRLQQILREKQEELFQLQRKTIKYKRLAPKKKTLPFVPPQKILLNNNIQSLKDSLELVSMLTGVEVKSYEAGEHCSVVFHIQKDSEHEVKHGLLIDMKRGANVISKSSLPLGFNLSEVMEEFANVMEPNCLKSIWKALMAYYDRLDQFEALKRLLKMDGQLFKILDGSHIEVTFTVRNDVEADSDDIELVLVVDYRIYDIRPKRYYFKEGDLPDDVVKVLNEQCAMFKRKPLAKAFKEAFIRGAGSYKLLRQIGATEMQQMRKRQKRLRNRNQNYNNDDTFHPEDCSDNSENKMNQN